MCVSVGICSEQPFGHFGWKGRPQVPLGGDSIYLLIDWLVHVYIRLVNVTSPRI